MPSIISATSRENILGEKKIKGTLRIEPGTLGPRQDTLSIGQCGPSFLGDVGAKSKKQFKSLFFILNDIAMLYEVQVHG